MNKNKNLYKLDDFFIILSFILILPLLYVLKPVIVYGLSNPDGVGEVLLQFIASNMVVITGLTASILFLQILGRLIRKEEKILVAILDSVIMYKTISINQLQQSLDLDRGKIERYIGKLSGIGRLNIHFDGNYVRIQSDIQDSPQSDPFHRPGDRSESSYHPSKVQSEQGFSGSAPKAENASMPASSREDLQNILTGMEKPASDETSGGKKFNIALFLILFFVFWPGAFIYAAKFYMSANKRSVIEDRLKKRLKEIEAGVKM